MSAGDATGSSYEEALKRVAAIMDANRRDESEIRQMSEISFRLWLEKVVNDVASVLGIGLAKAQAFVADIFTIAGNAAVAFTEAYSNAYQRSRQIKPRY